MPDTVWESVKRVDLAAGTLSDKRRTPQGGLIARATLTRTGVFSYRQPDGTIRRELRHPDEVFKPEALATLRGATYTDDHPDRVHPDNWKHVARGHIVDPKRDGKFVSGEVHIQDAEAIRKAEKGELQENSCGYECRIEPTPGVYEGEPYDVIQRDMKYNHVAGGPPGWGRAGPEVRLHLDGGIAVSVDAQAAALDSSMPTVEELQARLDAAKVEATAAATAAATALAAEKTRADAAATQVTALTSKVETLSGQVAAMKTTTDAADRTAVAAREQTRMDSYIDECIELVGQAHRHLDTRDAEWSRKVEDGRSKTNKEIQVELLKALRPAMKLDGKSDEFIAAACTVALADGARADGGMQELLGITQPLEVIEGGRRDGARQSRGQSRGTAKGNSPDDDEDEDVADAQNRMVGRMKDRYKDGIRRPGSTRDGAKEFPSHGAVGGRGNSGSDHSGGFGGGMA